MADQRLDAAEALGERHQPDAVAARACAAFEASRRRTTASRRTRCICRFASSCCGWDGRPGIEHARAPSGAPARNSASARPFALCCAIRTRERLRAAQHQPRVERAQDRARGVLDEPQPLDVLVARRDDDAADAVAVAVEVLRRAVDDQVRAELDRPLHARAGERVVDDQPDAVRACAISAARARDRSAASPGWSASRRTACFVFGRIALLDELRLRRVDVAERRAGTASAPCRTAGTCRRRCCR